jgi:hypothetical protein
VKINQKTTTKLKITENQTIKAKKLLSKPINTPTTQKHQKTDTETNGKDKPQKSKKQAKKQPEKRTKKEQKNIPKTQEKTLTKKPLSPR